MNSTGAAIAAGAVVIIAAGVVIYLVVQANQPPPPSPVQQLVSLLQGLTSGVSQIAGSINAQAQT